MFSPLVGSLKPVVVALLSAHVFNDRDQDVFEAIQLILFSGLIQTLIQLADLLLAATTSTTTV